MNAEIRLANGDSFDVKPVGVFGTSIQVTKNGTEVAVLKMNWQGQIVITLQNGQAYVLKTKGILHNNYFLENEGGENMIQIEPTFNWSGFIYNYAITYGSRPQDYLLVLLGVYAVHYLIATMSGATSGLA
ncbi:hypothetical protein HRH25_14515 [Flavisolibacter sp. BT320]|nr:hypothetical protein [Flavisolibacter longurius]